MQRWNINSKLCLNLLDAAYRHTYVKFAKQSENIKHRRAMMNLAAQAARISESKTLTVKESEEKWNRNLFDRDKTEEETCET